ncbi:MAG: DUF2029 domain-containing protein [Chloroflexota bacterium]|nr:DUF2029 domain-containing protein [Chloroflexota bacterium]
MDKTIQLPRNQTGTPGRELPGLTSNVSGRLLWAVPIAGLVLLVPRLLQFAQTSLTFLVWPWQFDYSEGVNLNATLELAAGHNIYKLADPSSFISAPYTPLYYLLNAPISWLTGPSLTAGRAISLLSTLVVAALLAFLVARATSTKLPALLAAALWLSCSPVIIWSALYTQHLTAAAFGMAGLAFAATSGARRGKGFYIAPLLFALAFYTKQSAIDMAAATILWLLIGNVRIAIRFAVAFATLVLVPFLVANFLLNGGLWQHVIQNQEQPLNIRRFWRLSATLWGEQWPVLGWGSACVVATSIRLALAWRTRRELLAGMWSLAVIYFVIAQGSVLARLGRAGVSYNHFIDAWLPACLLFGLSLGYLLKAETAGLYAGNRLRIALSRGSLLSLLCLFLLQLFSFSDPQVLYSGPWPTADLSRRMQAWSKIIASTPGDIFSEDEYLLLKNGHKVVYDDDFMFMNLSKLGRWDASLFEQALRDRRFALLWLQVGRTRLTTSALAVQDANYLLQVPDQLGMYVPKAVPDLPQYTLDCALHDGVDPLTLVGYSLPPGVAQNGVARGTTLGITLYWQAEGKMQYNYAGSVQLVNQKGERVLGQEYSHSFTIDAGDNSQASTMFNTTIDLSIPAAGLAPGRYKALIVVSRVTSGKPLTLPFVCSSADSNSGGTVLGAIDIK